ncbi:hypothetical protein DVG80_11270 [Rhodococcus erythropolis]|nr:hypothetical protein DVG80_11270 [Rhodococcus erythropolis]
MNRADPEKNCPAATLVASDHRSSVSFFGAERAVQISGCVDSFPIASFGRQWGRRHGIPVDTCAKVPYTRAVAVADACVQLGAVTYAV